MPSRRGESASALFLLWRAGLVRFIRRMLGSRAAGKDAEDIAQESYMKFATYERDKLSRALLWRIAVNATIDHLRREGCISALTVAEDARVQREAGGAWQFVDATLAPVDVNNLPAPSSCEPDAALMKEQLTRALRRVIRRLPRKARWVFVKRCLRNMSPLEVMVALEISRSAYEQSLTRAMRLCQADPELRELYPWWSL